ncbi:hypothetical protein M4R23_09080 [Acidovorax sp. GBBC 3332]|nr:MULTISPECIES: hypothetical protein [unclassified Acidovorax]MDA8449836.1 hypothetical protein [Acidovorax sp. GBBC 3297]MDA8459281.1 hypothetical protein [Acidovorax sp. GBBC 3333]MDA8464318.1 hypothetical protein [Acidovorax sp. GBBC 3332]MDA8469472.1 hypothetical protein [Acidovorax sp. GBBC 3299]
MTDTPEPTAPHLYSGPLSGVTLAGGQETMLVPGGTVHLPAGHEYTRTLIARGHLTPAAADADPAADASDTRRAAKGKASTTTSGNT